MSATAAVSAPPVPLVAIVDDDESLCRSLGRLLRHAGFQPLTFPSAESFIRSPERAHLKCLLLDIQLGGMSGLELHRLLLAEGDRTPVIYITAHDEPAARTEAMSTGCAGFFLKTDPGAALIETLRRVTTRA